MCNLLKKLDTSPPNLFLQIIVSSSDQSKVISDWSFNNEHSTNYLIIISCITHMCSVTYVNTQLTSPIQTPVFTAIQVNSVIITRLTGVYKRPDFERWRVKNNEICITGPRSWFER